jgi:hypothetical protein
MKDVIKNETDLLKRTHQNKRYLELGMSFWMGIGLMSIINVWKITENQHAITYSWIMFGLSLIAVSICAILIKIRK